MLVLSRAKNESIVIDHPAGPIVVMVTQIRGDRVRLGIAAPAEVKVLRRELWEPPALQSHMEIAP